MSTRPKDFEPDWTGLDPFNPRDRALAYRQWWTERDRKQVGDIDNLKIGDKVWRPNEHRLLIEEGVVIGLKQVWFTGHTNPTASDKGDYVQFTAAFGRYDAFNQTYQWKFFDSIEKAHAKLIEMANARLVQRNREAAEAQSQRDRIIAGKFGLCRFDAKGIGICEEASL